MTDYAGINNAILSHAAATGFFDRVTGHEPKNAPGNGLSAALWFSRLGSAPAQSGLQSTSTRYTVNVRVMVSMLQEPQDEIETNVANAADALMSRLSGNFTLSGLVRTIDLLGMGTQDLGGEAGYLNQDGKMYRAFVLIVPMILNDVWTQAA